MERNYLDMSPIQVILCSWENLVRPLPNLRLLRDGESGNTVLLDPEYELYVTELTLGGLVYKLFHSRKGNMIRIWRYMVNDKLMYLPGSRLGQSEE